MIFTPGILKGSFLIDLSPVSDPRGWFGRFYCKNEFQEIGHQKEWVQLNHSFTYKMGTIRGLHFQKNPYSEIKMVKCIAGRIFDVIVDLRCDSDTFLQWYGVELSSENNRMLYIPEGFAHGFQCLSDNCGLIYHHSEFYRPEAEAGLRWDDPRLSISWPLEVAVLSERDAGHPYINKNFKGI